MGGTGTTTLTYLVTNHQGSVSEALDTNGTVRYQSGSFPTSYGYTGQRSDAATSGLDYYGARYYDPAVGQFTSADTLLAGGLNRYGYVGGNPETLADPSGHTPKPTASDPVLQRYIDQLWRDEAPGSSMDALLEEASTGAPTRNKWHYQKVWGWERRIQQWIDLVCSSPRFAAACRAGNGAALNADLGIAYGIVLDMWKAIQKWEASPYYTGTPGQNPPPTTPISSAPPLPAPSPGLPTQPALPTPGGIPAQPGNPAPVPGFEPAQLPPGIGRAENRPTFGLPDVPGFAPANVPPSIWQAEWRNPWTVVAIGAAVAITYVVVKGYPAGSGNVNVRPSEGAPGGCYACGIGGGGMAPGSSGGGGRTVD